MAILTAVFPQASGGDGHPRLFGFPRRVVVACMEARSAVTGVWLVLALLLTAAACAPTLRRGDRHDFEHLGFLTWSSEEMQGARPAAALPRNTALFFRDTTTNALSVTFSPVHRLRDASLLLPEYRVLMRFATDGPLACASPTLDLPLATSREVELQGVDAGSGVRVSLVTSRLGRDELLCIRSGFYLAFSTSPSNPGRTLALRRAFDWPPLFQRIPNAPHHHAPIRGTRPRRGSDNHAVATWGRLVRRLLGGCAAAPPAVAFAALRPRVGWNPFVVARPAGLEPAASDLEGRCSIQLSYGRLD